MRTNEALSGDEAISAALDILEHNGKDVDVGRWQGVPTGGRPDMVTREIINMNFTCEIPQTIADATEQCQPNIPWAENHFQERVARSPANPGVQYREWPWWRGQEKETAADPDKPFQFTHTYMERFWPKEHHGIRYEYGDLDDVVELLRRQPHTRQATFPIFFPEDTGVLHGGRTPCTLHYHFLMREFRMHLFYPIRSCDAVRHFRDDVYMAMRLCQWVLDELRHGDNDYEQQCLWEDVTPGILCFTAYSFHVHHGDLHRLP